MCPSLTGLESVPCTETLILKVTLPGPAEICVKYEQVRVLSPHYNLRKVLARCAACFAEHACLKSSLLLNSKHFLAAKLTFAVAISISKHQRSHHRADVCLGWTCHEARVWRAAVAAPESLGTGAAAGAVVAGGVRAAGFMLETVVCSCGKPPFSWLASESPRDLGQVT